MARDFRLPDVGEGIQEAEVIKWMVEEGDTVEEDDGVLEVETDKAIIEIPSSVSGEMTEKLYEVGDTAAVGDVIARFETDSIQTPETDGSVVSTGSPETGLEPTSSSSRSRVFAAPSTRRLAREENVEIEDVDGTGQAGRVTKADVERAAEREDDEDLPTEVARRKARKEFERRKRLDEDGAGAGGGRDDEERSEYETAFGDDDEGADEEGGIIIGDDPGGSGQEAAGDGGPDAGGGTDDGIDSDGEETADEVSEEPVEAGEADEVDGLTPEFTEDVADPEDEDDGLTPEFTEDVADPEDEDDGLTPEFDRNATTVDRTGMAPEFQDESTEAGDRDTSGFEDGDVGGVDGDAAEEGDETGRREADDEEGGDGGLDLERVEAEAEEATPLTDDGDGDTDDETEISQGDADESEVSEKRYRKVRTDPSDDEDDPTSGRSAGSREPEGREGGRGRTGSSAGPMQPGSTGDRGPGGVAGGDVGSGGGDGGGSTVSYTGNRRRMGERLSEAVKRPLVTHHDEVDVQRLHEVQEEVEDVTYTPFVVKACVAALQEHQALNSSFDEDAEEIEVHDGFHVGVGTATEDGLRVPVLRDADSKDIAELSRELDGLVERARSGDLSEDEVEGGTFTVTNVGAIGGEYSTPIVNGDEAAVLALGEVRERARVIDGEVEPRHVVTLSLTFDHRIVDGAEAARFTNEVRRYLRKPALLLVD